MKKILTLVFVVALGYLAGDWIGHVALAQAATQSITDQAIFYWDPVTVDTLGGPVTVTAYEFGVFPGTIADLNAAGVLPPVRTTTAGAVAAPSLTAITAFATLKGGTYTAGVRALSLSGTTTLRGPYSVPIALQFSRPAAAPTNLRLTITVTP